MDVFLPKGFEADQVRSYATRALRTRQLRVEVEGIRYPVLRRWANGFAVSAGEVPMIEGVVSLFDGVENLGECLIVKCEKSEYENVFTVKRASSFNYVSAAEIEGGAQAGVVVD
jgi:hypothetical protein